MWGSSHGRTRVRTQTHRRQSQPTNTLHQGQKPGVHRQLRPAGSRATQLGMEGGGCLGAGGTGQAVAEDQGMGNAAQGRLELGMERAEEMRIQGGAGKGGGGQALCA